MCWGIEIIIVKFQICLFVPFFHYSSQTIRLKSLNFSVFDGDHPRDIITMFGGEYLLLYPFQDNWASGVKCLVFGGDHPGVAIESLVNIIIKSCL